MAIHSNDNDNKVGLDSFNDNSHIKFNKLVDNGSNLTSSTNVDLFGLILFILLLVAVIRVLVNYGDSTDADIPLFYDLLTTLQNVPDISFDWLSTDFFTAALDFPDWLVWAEIIIDILRSLIGVIGFLFTGLVQACLFIIWILKWIFAV